MMEQLTFNAVVEGRFKDAAFYYTLLANEILKPRPKYTFLKMKQEMMAKQQSQQQLQGGGAHERQQQQQQQGAAASSSSGRGGGDGGGGGGGGSNGSTDASGHACTLDVSGTIALQGMAGCVSGEGSKSEGVLW